MTFNKRPYWKITPWIKALPKKLAAHHLVKKFHIFKVAKKGSGLFLQDLTTGLYPEPDKSNPQPPILFLLRSLSILSFYVAETVQSVEQLAMGWAVWGSNTSGGGQNLLHPFIPVPKSTSPLYNGYQDFFLGVKRMGHNVDHPLP
jgi:hypothetical protein